METDIIYEDQDFLVINKPAGLVVHPDKTHHTGTLVQQIVKKYPEIKKVGDHSTDSKSSPQASSWQERPGLAHRLDKDTSGLLLVARNQKSFNYFKSLFSAGKIKKTYLVLVLGNLKNKNGVIDLPIGRSGKDMRRLAWPEYSRRPGKGRKGKEREAITEYRVIKKFDGFTLCEARPLTGRTHQIRAHFAALGHPVVCDKLYGGKKLICPAGLTRQFLHAWKLEFVSQSGVKMSFECDLPDDLEKVLEELK